MWNTDNVLYEVWSNSILIVHKIKNYEAKTNSNGELNAKFSLKLPPPKHSPPQAKTLD